MITLVVRATSIWVFFFAHIPFVMNRTFNTTLAERLQQHTVWLNDSEFNYWLGQCLTLLIQEKPIAKFAMIQS